MNGKHDNHGQFSSLGEMFFNCLAVYENKIFQYIDDTNETTTFSDILQWSIRTAIKLKQRGITRNDIISACTHNQKYSPVPFIASQLLGTVCCNFDPKLSHLDTIHLVKLVQPKILFVAKESLEFMELCLQEAGVTTEIVVFGLSDKYSQFSEYLESNEDEKPFEPVNIEDTSNTAVIFFSSGTTGLPKGICLSHNVLLPKVTQDVSFTSASQSQTVFLMYTTLYWISSAYSLIITISAGYSSVIRIDFDPVYTWKLIEKYRVTTMFLAPYHAIDFLNQQPSNVDSSSLVYFLIGSCAVPTTLIDKLKKALPQAKILQSYGQTETAGVITSFSIADPEECDLQLRKPKSCGKMRKGMEWKIVDVETEEILGVNQQGELRVKHDGYFMNGYYKIDSSFAYDSEGYFKTGDILYYDEDDCFYVVNRLKEIFKYRGWHILPQILEDILITHPAVSEAAVIGIPHEIDGEHPMGVVTLSDGYDSDCEKEIEAFLNEKVADSQKLRAGVKIVDVIPRTPTGKIKRIALKNMILNNVKNNSN